MIYIVDSLKEGYSDKFKKIIFAIPYIVDLIKNFNIEQLDRKILNELIDMIYIIDKNNIKIEFKNI